jgi:tRNA G18 (ribose-2'-O)-methylase SpoU
LLGPADVTRITVASAADPRIASFRNLKDATVKRDGLFIVESERVLRRLIESTYSLHSVLLTPERFARLADDVPVLAESGSVLVLEQQILFEVLGFPLPRGVIALAHRHAEPSVSDVFSAARCVVILEDVVDPENIGAVFRHLACFGADAVICSPHSGDPLSRKSVRASMGWALHKPFVRCEPSNWPMVLEDMRADGWTVAALTPEASGSELWRSDLSGRVAFVVGSEHDGLSESAKQHASQRVHIPMADGVDSLNVATTVALALYEWRRAVASPL